MSALAGYIGYDEWALGKVAAEREVGLRSVRLQAYSRSAVGLVSEDVRLSGAYRADKRAYEEAFARLRAVNGQKVYLRRYNLARRGQRAL